MALRHAFVVTSGDVLKGRVDPPAPSRMITVPTLNDPGIASCGRPATDWAGGARSTPCHDYPNCGGSAFQGRRFFDVFPENRFDPWQSLSLTFSFAQIDPRSSWSFSFEKAPCPSSHSCAPSDDLPFSAFAVIFWYFFLLFESFSFVGGGDTFPVFVSSNCRCPPT